MRQDSGRPIPAIPAAPDAPLQLFPDLLTYGLPNPHRDDRRAHRFVPAQAQDGQGVGASSLVLGFMVPLPSHPPVPCPTPSPLPVRTRNSAPW